MDFVAEEAKIFRFISDIVAQFPYKISLRFGKAEINEKECFKEKFWGISDFWKWEVKL